LTARASGATLFVVKPADPPGPAAAQGGIEDGRRIARSRVPDYDKAAGQLLWELLNDLMAAQDPLLERIQRRPVDHV